MAIIKEDYHLPAFELGTRVANYLAQLGGKPDCPMCTRTALANLAAGKLKLHASPAEAREAAPEPIKELDVDHSANGRAGEVQDQRMSQEELVQARNTLDQLVALHIFKPADNA